MNIKTKQHHTYYYSKKVIDDQKVGKGQGRLITILLSVPTLKEDFSITYYHKPGDMFSAGTMLQARIKDVLTMNYKNKGFSIPKEVDRFKWIEKHDKTAHDITATLEVEADVKESPENDWSV